MDNVFLEKLSVIKLLVAIKLDDFVVGKVDLLHAVV